MSLNLIVSEVGPQYRVLTAHLRGLTTKEINRKGYNHIVKPNYRGGKNKEWPELRFRVTLLVREGLPNGRGIRNLQCGDSELVVCIHGSFLDPTNYLAGFELAETPASRVVITNPINRYIPLADEIPHALMEGEGYTTLNRYLRNGEYGMFVGFVLHRIERALAAIKNPGSFRQQNDAWQAYLHYAGGGS